MGDNSGMGLALIYVLLMSVYGYIAMGIDKSKAKKGGRRRLSEKHLMGVAAFGGSPGIWIGMRTFRHKTKHAKFRYGVPALLLAQAAIAYYLASYT